MWIPEGVRCNLAIAGEGPYELSSSGTVTGATGVVLQSDSATLVREDLPLDSSAFDPAVSIDVRVEISSTAVTAELTGETDLGDVWSVTLQGETPPALFASAPNVAIVCAGIDPLTSGSVNVDDITVGVGP